MLNKKVAFLMVAAMVAGTSFGCEEPNRLPSCTDCGTSTEDPTTILDQDPLKASDVCKDPTSCLDSSSCADGAGFAACLCVTDEYRCHTFANCKGVGTCDYDCSTDEQCTWSVCQGSAKCAEHCVADNLPTDGDFDGDGIPNGIENGSPLLDPCKADSDGDGVPDGSEDLNHNGVYEPELGETDPGNASDFVKPDTPTAKAKEAVCTSSMLNGKAGRFRDMQIALFNDVKYTPEEDTTALVTRFDDTKHSVYGFYGSGTAFSFDLLLAQNLTKGSYFASSTFAAADVPLAAWLSNGVYNHPQSTDDKLKQKDLQIVPNHSVDRAIYQINLSEGQTLENVRDLIAKTFDSSIVPTAGSTTCNTNTAYLHIARSTYINATSVNRLYGGALICQSTDTSSKSGNSTAIEAMSMCEDVRSGTMISPTPKTYTSAPVGGYLPFQNYICQTEDYGNSTGSVDFIWVVDNSGSMKDEIDNLVSTVKLFAQRLSQTTIDYRAVVTTTDAYVVDEEFTVSKNGTKAQQYTVVKDDCPKYFVDPETGAFVQVEGSPSKYYYESESGEKTTVVSDAKKVRCVDDFDPTNKYLNFFGVHTLYKMRPGFLRTESEDGTDVGEIYSEGEETWETPFTSHVQAVSSAFCKNNFIVGSVDKYSNICGIGYEDGIKSGAVVLKRLGLNIENDADKAISGMTDDEWKEFKEFKRVGALMNGYLDPCYQCYLTKEKTQNETAQCRQRVSSCTESYYNQTNLRSDALKYIIWVSDEESRQFKEEGEVKKGSESGDICLTGYKLKVVSEGVYQMATGRLPSDATNDICNPSMKAKLSELQANDTLTAESTLEEIKTAYPDYYNMLMYYIGEYRKFAGNGGIVGFALVGDAGLEKGAACRNLKLCKGTCCMDADCTESYTMTDHDGADNFTTNGFVGCFSCRDGEWVDDTAATVGANYGLSYIHLARFLSKITDDGQNSGKEGGSASICNTEYTTTIDAIVDDVIGRVASHPLKGYPISSTIKVSISSKNKTTVLTRGASENGWNYDASQNAITFTKVNATPEDVIAISYVIWSKSQG